MNKNFNRGNLSKMRTSNIEIALDTCESKHMSSRQMRMFRFIDKSIQRTESKCSKYYTADGRYLEKKKEEKKKAVVFLPQLNKIL